MGTWQATATLHRGFESSWKTAGPACWIYAFPETGWNALAEIGRIWRV
jgi:hypothetical protein